MPKPIWKASQPTREAVKVEFAVTSQRDKLRILLLSDLHLDHPECDRALLTRHLKQAKASGAAILIRGDIFDAMQSRDDKRRSMAGLSVEYKVGNYFGALVDHAYEYLKPYAANIVAISPGNHETKVLERSGFCLTSALALRLDCYVQPYEGVTRIAGTMAKTQKDSFLIYHHHGKGGAAKSRGVLDSDWFAGRVTNATVYHLGHNHQAYVVPDTRLVVTASNRVIEEYFWHVRTPGYQGGHRSHVGFETERAFRIPYLGGAWVDVSFGNRHNRRIQVHCQMTDMA